MTATEWVVVNRTWCERVGMDTVLMEQRVYPAEILPDTSGHRVIARKCSCATECNLAEIPCKWSFTRPAFDPFELA
jgi:hypothetical protein